MYFANRMQAGRMLAAQIKEHYRGADTALIALSDGGFVVGIQIAQQLRSPIGMLLTDEITLPKEIQSIAAISQEGTFSYNPAYERSEIDEMVGEYRGLIEEQKVEKLHGLNRLAGRDVMLRKDLLRDRNIILVHDGITTGFPLDMAMDFLKPINYKKLIVATPLATVPAVDRMHVLIDDIYCLSVIEDFISTDHYYDSQDDVPSHEVVVRSVGQILKNWHAEPVSPSPPQPKQ